MDMCLIGTEGGFQIRPTSIHGMLWLQTHFEDEHWEALATNKVQLPLSDREILHLDAEKAGLSLISLPTLSTAEQI